jgi:LPS-assembly protein
LTPVMQVIAAPSEPRDDDQANEDAITLNFDTTSLFLSDRFTGFDRYEGGVRANAGLSYTLLGENGGFIRTSFGESFHIAGDNSFAAGSGLDGTSSDLVGAIALQLNESVMLGYQARIEEDLSRINVQEASLGLTLDRISGSLSYADVAAASEYGRPDHEQQVWGDAKYILGVAWNVFGGFRYDIEGNRFMEKTIGIGYECDCMSASLSYSQKIEEAGQTDHRIEFGVELRTIGEVDGGFTL